MELEMLNIYDQNLNHIGTASRQEVHKRGLWHKTFHCWVVAKEEDGNYIYFQLRSNRKKDYPNKLDITAAGHLLATETIEDGIREVKEEIGIDVAYKELVCLGMVQNCILSEKMVDQEFSYVYLHYLQPKASFTLQEEEVAGIVKAEFDHFYNLCMDRQTEMIVQVIQGEDNKQLEHMVSKNDFVPHEETYFKAVADLIKKELERKN
ncbi:MAG: NUDIX domain-containing protein [Bacillus sp. (in: firmicutes)]